MAATNSRRLRLSIDVKEQREAHEAGDFVLLNFLIRDERQSNFPRGLRIQAQEAQGRLQPHGKTILVTDACRSPARERDPGPFSS